MSRALAGMRARRGSLLTLALMVAVVTAGTVTVLGFAAAAGTSPWLSLPLMVVGAFAVPAVGHELAVARREEIGLARLRGVHGRRLAVFLLAEPVLAIAVGTVVGVGLGVAGAWLATWRWLAEPAVTLTRWSLLAATGVVVVGTFTVLAGMVAAGREPLSDQVSIAARSRPDSNAVVFGSVLILVAGALAIYRSGRGTDPDWVVLAGPALVGLAAGQLTVWLLRGVARVATARTSGSALPAYLATRRVGRTPDRGTALRLLVAAGAVATLAATGAAGVAGWTDEQSRLVAGAPYRVDLDADAQAAMRAAYEHDPDGRYLAAAVVVADENLRDRRAYVDTSRFAAVVDEFFAGTDAAEIPEKLDALVGEIAEPIVADRLEVAVAEVPEAPIPPRFDVRDAVTFHLDMATAGGDLTRASVVVERGDGGPVRHQVRVPECVGGCTVVDFEVESGAFFEDDGRERYFVPDGPREPARLTAIDFGDVDLLAEDWEVDRPGATQQDTDDVVRQDGGLQVTFSQRGRVRATPGYLGAAIPVLATDGFGWPDDEEQTVDNPSGDPRPTEVVDRVPALPLVGGGGLVGDLGLALFGAGPTVPTAGVMVLAAEDTPAEVLQALIDEGGTLVRLDDVAAAEARATGAVQAWMYAVMAGCCLLVALLALHASGTRQRAAYRRDVAALRVVGVPTAQIRSAGRGELVLLAAVAVVAGAGAGLVAARLLLPGLPLVDVPEFAVPLDPVSSVLPALGSGLVLAAIVAVVAGRGRRLDAELTRPSTLREGQWHGAVR